MLVGDVGLLMYPSVAYDCFGLEGHPTKVAAHYDFGKQFGTWRLRNPLSGP